MGLSSTPLIIRRAVAITSIRRRNQRRPVPLFSKSVTLPIEFQLAHGFESSCANPGCALKPSLQQRFQAHLKPPPALSHRRKSFRRSCTFAHPAATTCSLPDRVPAFRGRLEPYLNSGVKGDVLRST